MQNLKVVNLVPTTQRFSKYYTNKEMDIINTTDQNDRGSMMLQDAVNCELLMVTQEQFSIMNKEPPNNRWHNFDIASVTHEWQ